MFSFRQYSWTLNDVLSLGAKEITWKIGIATRNPAEEIQWKIIHNSLNNMFSSGVRNAHSEKALKEWSKISPEKRLETMHSKIQSDLDFWNQKRILGEKITDREFLQNLNSMERILTSFEILKDLDAYLGISVKSSIPKGPKLVEISVYEDWMTIRISKIGEFSTQVLRSLTHETQDSIVELAKIEIQKNWESVDFANTRFQIVK